MKLIDKESLLEEVDAEIKLTRMGLLFTEDEAEIKSIKRSLAEMGIIRNIIEQQEEVEICLMK